MGVHRVALAELGDELSECRHKSEVVEGHGPEVEDQSPGVIQDAADPVLEVGELAHHHLGIARDQALNDLRLEDEVGHRLRRPIVHVAGDAHPLFLDDLKGLPRGVAEPGRAVGRACVGGEKVVEAAIDGTEHLLLCADAGQAGAELDLALLGRSEIGTDLGKRSKGAVDLVDVAGGQNAEERAPAAFGLVLGRPQPLQPNSHGRQLIVERCGGRIEIFDALGHQESNTG